MVAGNEVRRHVPFLHVCSFMGMAPVAKSAARGNLIFAMFGHEMVEFPAEHVLWI